MPKHQNRRYQVNKAPDNQAGLRTEKDSNNAQRPDWLSFANEETADDDFLANREDVISDEGRFE